MNLYMYESYIKSIHPVKFTEWKISTIGCIGKLFEDKAPSNFNVYNICEYIDMNSYPELYYIEYKGKTKKRIKEDISIDDVDEEDVVEEHKKSFANSATFVVNIKTDRKPIKAKISTNGSLQIPGFTSESEIKDFIDIMTTIFKRMDDNLFDKTNLKIHISSISMIKYNFSLLDEKIQLDPMKYSTFLIQEGKIFSSYECNDSNSAEISWQSGSNNIECYPFYSGKINVTSLRSFEEIESTYNYITKMINDNIRHFIMFDNLSNLLMVLEKNQCVFNQKTDEWKLFRLKTIGASEVSSCFDMAFSCSRDYFIKSKIEAIKDGKLVSFSSKATRHGECYEPIAIQLYVRHHNHGLKHGKIFAYQPSSIKHENFPFITASPDSIIFITTFDPDYKKKYTLEEIKQLIADGMIENFYTLEVKCPVNYKVYSAGKKMIECTDGYVPSYYWCQTQQQMHVICANYGIFNNNHFIEYTKEEYQNDNLTSARNYRGIIYKLYADNYQNKEIAVLYPANVLAKEEEALQDLDEQLKSYEKNDYRSHVVVYWKLITFKNTHVPFDKYWETDYVPKIVSAYNEIIDTVNMMI